MDLESLRLGGTDPGVCTFQTIYDVDGRVIEVGVDHHLIIRQMYHSTEVTQAHIARMRRDQHKKTGYVSPSAIKSKITMAGRVIEIKPVETAEPSKDEMEAKERRKQETIKKHERWLEKRKKRNEKLNAESRVVQLREKKERHKEKKREARRLKRNETVRETAEKRIARREARMSTKVNRHTRANKIWVKMRRMRRTCLRMMDNVRNYVDEVHKKTAGFINFDVFIILPFETQSMMKKERSNGKKRKLSATSARSMCSWSRYRFRTYVRAVMGVIVLSCVVNTTHPRHAGNVGKSTTNSTQARHLFFDLKDVDSGLTET